MSTADTTSLDSRTTIWRATRLALMATIAMVDSTTIVAAAAPECRAAFEQLDANKDGIIEEIEFALNKVRAAYLDADPNTNVIPFKRTHFSRRAFDELDLNHDGELDDHEIVNAPIFQFAWWDRSRDNVIDWTEFHAGCQDLER